MNKFKKIAASVVSVVMAGTMVTSLAACNGDPTPNNPNKPDNSGLTVDAATSAKIDALLEALKNKNSLIREVTNADGWDTAKEYWEYLSANKDENYPDGYGVKKTDGSGDINYQTYQNRGNVTLNIAIGYNNAKTGTNFSEDLGAMITLPDGKTYTNKSLKPAWAAMGQDLNITWNNKYTGQTTAKNLEYMTTTNDGSVKVYNNVDMFTTDLSVAVEYVGKSTDILNLADYLDYMPHFKEYLETNPIVYLSLLQYGMDTTTGDNKRLYVAPYFDGTDDIERYCIIRQDWADKLLNGNADLSGTTTFSESCGSVAVEEYMQSTGKLDVESANYNGTQKIIITKNYDAALAAAKDDSKPLGAAYKAIAGSNYDGTSGNIVSIMNAALTANAEATGDQLTKLFRAYIDVCYVDEDGVQYYTSENRSDLFNGYDACWDVDDLVAMLRCVMTSGTSLVVSGNKVTGIVPRTGQNDRTPTMVTLACQLYGVRGADSRYENTYIDANGTLQDARNDKEFYVALSNFNKLRQENLIIDYPASDAVKFEGGSMSAGSDKTLEAFMTYDYSQTQTLNNFYANEGVSGSSVTFSSDFNFAPIVTPIAKWSVNGTQDTVMRFTESWRSTKTSGLALNGALAAAGNEKKLEAALEFVDYLYSQDGQIVSTYGPMADANGSGGFWYNKVAATDAEKAKSFRFKGTDYVGLEYGKKYTPTITQNLYKSFCGESVNGFALSSNEDIKTAKLSFTNYARMVIGSTLPVGVKDQSFENQLTAQKGKAGADRVAANLKLETIKGLQIVFDTKAEGFNWWYVCVPTGMPIDDTEVSNVLNNTNMLDLKYMTGTQKDSNNKNFFSIMNYIIVKGLNGTYNYQDVSYTF